MREKNGNYRTDFGTSVYLRNCPCRLLLPPFSLLPAYGVTPYAGAATWLPTRRNPTQTALKRPRFAPSHPLWLHEREARAPADALRDTPPTALRSPPPRRRLPWTGLPQAAASQLALPSSLSYLRHSSPPRTRLERPGHHCHGCRARLAAEPPSPALHAPNQPLKRNPIALLKLSDPSFPSFHRRSGATGDQTRRRPPAPVEPPPRVAPAPTQGTLR
jgi:hypothetical protein